MTDFSDIGTVTALVLGATRGGPEDPVAKLQGKSHKCLAEIDGVVMIERVLRELLGARYVGRVFVSMEAREFLMTVPACQKWLEEGRLQFVESGGNLHESVSQAAERISGTYPLLISTADNALHTAEMIDHFCGETLASDADVGVAVTSSELVRDQFPDAKLAYHKLRGGAISSCNLYALMNETALNAARAFESGGQFGKKPSRVLKAFGLMTLVLYKLRLLSLDRMAARLSRSLRVSITPVMMPFAEGPIDVDTLEDFALIERALMARRESA